MMGSLHFYMPKKKKNKNFIPAAEPLHTNPNHKTMDARILLSIYNELSGPLQHKIQRKSNEIEGKQNLSPKN